MVSLGGYGSRSRKRGASVADKVTLDTNILVYAFDRSEGQKHQIAQNLLWLSQGKGALLTAIALGEFFWVLDRKAIVPPRQSRQYLSDLGRLFPVSTYDVDTLLRASTYIANLKLSFWDAVLLSNAEENGCTICFSEDMHDGLKAGNIVVRNPFSAGGLSAAARAALGVP